MSERPVVVWFRNDLRLSDHRALKAALATGAPLAFLYILDDKTADRWRPGGASRWWLHHSLSALAAAIAERGAALVLRQGDTAKVLTQFVDEIDATAVYFSREYEPWAVALEKQLKTTFANAGIAFKRYSGRLLREPEDIRNKAGEPYKVYTPFWKELSSDFSPPRPLPAPKSLNGIDRRIASDTLTDWKLLPLKPDWAKGFFSIWTPGEAGAHQRLKDFMNVAVASYATDRDRPGIGATSRLSPHLHFGEITPAQCWIAAADAAERRSGADKGVETFLKELVWREFSHTLLFYWPDIPENVFRPEFAAFPWRSDKVGLKAWQNGKTGYPIVDAGMRELWATGYMHNRVRMIAASFLTKHLLIPWQIGEAWFWDTLVDADLANNAASWQWVAGSGADAAPYFRIFNPVLQGQKFDPKGTYVRRWVPEIAGLPDAVIHRPWDASDSERARASVMLGETYPKPIVDHNAARERALAAYETMKSTSEK